jgi:hypothetical protein
MICFIMVYKCLLVSFTATKHKLPKFFLKRTNFIVISKFTLRKVIQSVLQLLLGWSFTVRDVSAMKLRYMLTWSIVTCKAMLIYYCINYFGYLFVLVSIVWVFIHIKVIRKNCTFCNMTGSTIRWLTNADLIRTTTSAVAVLILLPEPPILCLANCCQRTQW